MNIILTGFKNSGKSTIGRLLAERLDYGFIDIDNLIVALHRELTGERLTISHIFKEYGESYFRELEQQTISQLTGLNNVVIATAGGSIINAVNIEHLQKIGRLIYLQVDKDILQQRLLQQQDLPIFIDAENPIASFDNYYDQRIKLYESIANITINANLERQQIVEIIIENMKT